ncbi:carcinine hydrolase/isopenicillin-N N-acyltransferase family protein [Actinomadura hibisca]|uniref:carcinine hydrolase/isopenicillin-N N-acyltransferase family protein n=1 Tax=Actinomadura hibisca TaxID=68565 RepID=UPI000829E818|nr:carcinine hydrolase/isopenicillin-N N-acyltransferase family protein [Actinomadura hibisca]
MTPPRPSRRAVLLGVPAALAAGCGGDARSTARSAAAPLTADERRSLATLKVLDAAHPLLSMTLYGPYDPMRQIALAPVRDRPWACSLFLAGEGPQGPLFGRNFDWDANAALLLTTVPPRGPRTISMVDVSYLGIGREAARRATSDAAVGRKLLQAVGIPFDGMNEHGLAVGMAAVPTGEPPRLAGRPVVGSARIQRLVLDRARTVEEAVAVFARHNVDFGADGPPLHYLLADRNGDSAAVEFVDGRLRTVPGAGNWHDMVNFVLATTPGERRADDRRYRAIAERMRATGGRLDVDGAMDLLRKVEQAHTRWSAVYELRGGTVHLALDRDFRRRRTARLAR